MGTIEARAGLRLRYGPKHVTHNMKNFRLFSRLSERGDGARFPRAQPRTRPSSARQSILLITEMFFDCLVAIISLKAAEIGMSEVAKKLDTSAPHQRTSKRQITQREVEFCSIF